MTDDVFSYYPYVVVRLACRFCKRRGQYRLARLAAKYGSDIAMVDLLEHLAGDCRYWRPRHPYQQGCGALFVDLAGGPAPDLPPAMRELKVVKGGRE